MTKKRILFLLLLLAVSVASVYFITRGQSGREPKKGEEIMMGSECGFDYLPCCQGEPACSFGQKCCSDPNDPNRNYCADECTCGSEGEFCCQGNKCKEGLACHSGNCRPCGVKGEICCPDSNSCEEGLVCFKGQCVECGITGNPCCENGEVCDIDSGRAGCFNGICRPCGSKGHKACPKGAPCLIGHLYNNGVCYMCGEINQPCCDENSGRAYDCNPKKGLICDLGFCRRP